MVQIAMNAAEARMRDTFTALMWSLSYPGRIHILPAAGQVAFEVVAEALVDLETSFYTPHPEFARAIGQLGARMHPPQSALYQFYPTLCEDDLVTLRMAPVGTYAYPDASATLVLGCNFDEGQRLRLRGPGVDGAIHLTVGALPTAFWALRAEMIRYPLGWDVFLVMNDWIVGLPRTTQVEVF